MVHADAIARLIHDAFADYHARFAEITRRAKVRFETADWSGARTDAVERIELYDQCIAECALRLQSVLLGQAHDRASWIAARTAFEQLITGQIDRELYKTFYNTLSRRFFRTRGVDPALEFVALDVEPTDAITHPVARHSYAVSEQRPTDTFARVLADYGFEVPYAHRTRCAAAIAVRLQDDLAHWGANPVRGIELLDTVFYRERRAYLVGRVFGEHRFSPCVIALINDGGQLKAEAVLTHRGDVAHLFGTSRSYFHADLTTVGDAVVFLRSLLPGKPIDEIYTVLGRAKQGKTERYRTFFHHFAAHPDERLVHAEGTPGMVMAVFTLPSYPLVFKVIRDRFAYPKAMSRQDVEDKYDLVFHLDRVGRLLDTQAFRFLRFPRALFTGAAARAARKLRPEPQRGWRGPGHTPVLRAATAAAAEPVSARAESRCRARRRTRLWPGDQGHGPQQHFPRRHAAEELRRVAPWPRGVLRLRRTAPGHRLPVPRLAAADHVRGTDGGCSVVPRGRGRRVPRAVSAVPRPARCAGEGAEGGACRSVPPGMVARPPVASRCR
jgi:isocitrate dehydrogenase kinase/phosphatase